ncbi:MAG TPA: hypothetical protein VFL83_07395 [Anaeromyxobacter sp.]|nr:hypothetical protein [Anaeromyxobacter sp.]
MRGARTGERGAALLIVMVAVAVLTALAADLAYESQVSLRIAANARNDLQAAYLARSGVALSRLVLSFQQELDAAAPTLPGQVVVRPQLWKLAPVTSELTDALFGGATRIRPEEGAAPAGPAAGTFQVDLDDEATKVNFQLDALGQSGLLAGQVQAIWQLICQPGWDPLFDREDANGVRVSRPDLLINLRDWVDVDPITSALAASFAPSGCVMATPQSPFEAGYGDENFPYDRGDDRYRAKNARMDSLDELYLVSGIGEAFMAAFRDQITVYLPRDAQRNVNDTNPVRLYTLARMMAAPPDQPRLADPAFLETLVKLVQVRTLGGVLALTPSDFGTLVAEAGVGVDQNLLAGPNSPFTDRSTVFRLRSAGRAGDVQKTLDVVVRLEKTAQGTAPGRILHWREE